MDQEFNSDDFEHFLKQKTDQYKIYPSEKTWRGIYNVLHPKKNWFKIGGGLLLLGGVFFLGNNVLFDNPTAKQLKSRRGENTTYKSAPINALPRINIPSIKFGQQTAAAKQIISLQQANAGSLEYKPAKAIVMTSERIEHSPLAIDHLVNTAYALKYFNEPAVKVPKIVDITGNTLSDETYKIEENEIVTIEENKQLKESMSSEKANTLEAVSPIRITPGAKNKFNLQFYFSPTISYRRLADNKNIIHSGQRNIPLASNYLNIDRFVDHNPSIGAELGSNILMKAGRNLTIKSGLQLNYARYSIKAYKFYHEKASIALNPVGRIADTLTAFTSFRNFSGYYPENLQNQYFQISAPIGVDFKILGNKRLQLNIAGTIQPTYLLYNDTYLLSTDYVNYAKQPSLVQKWNLNTSFETFISYKVGGVRWQVGPQFRYQLLSTYNDRYPIKEYLMEYGVKVGISKTLR